MDTVTIEIAEAMIIVHQERLPGTRLYMTASGLHIYKKGTVTPDRKDDVFWHCQNECTVRRIPLNTLRNYTCGCGKKKTPRINDPFLAGLWDTLTDEENGQLAYECSMCGKYTGSVDEMGHCSSCRTVWNS